MKWELLPPIPITSQDIKQPDQWTHGQSLRELGLKDINFTRSAMITVGLGVQQIADRTGLSVTSVKKRLTCRLYGLKPSGVLMLHLQLPEAGLDLAIGIPEPHWRLSTFPDPVH